MVLRLWILTRGLIFAAVILGTVRAEAPRLKWRRASTPEFTLLTPLDEKRAVERANEFSQYIAALRAYFGNPDGKLPKLTMVVFSKPRDFDRYRPLGKDGKVEDVAGFFIRHENWAIIGLSRRADKAARQIMFHEGVHWYLHGSEKWMPPWLDEGMAEVFSTFEIENNTVRWGRAPRARTASLYQHGLIPMEKLMQFDRSQLFTDDGKGTELFYGQSWAFVHYLMFGENRMPFDAARKYVALLHQVADPQTAFIQAFGRTYAEMDVQLKRYINGGKYYVSRRPVVPVPPVTVAPATDQEVDEALGRLALVGNRLSLALEHSRAMITRHSEDPRGYALLALALKESNQAEDALEAFELAARYGSKDFRPYFEVAYALHRQAAGFGGSLGLEEARRAADYYRRAIALFPNEECYANFAGLVGVADQVTAEDQATLAEGALLFPQNLRVRLGMAQLRRRLGDADGARKLLDAVLASSGTLSPAIEAYALRVRASWEDEDFLQQLDRLMQGRRYEDALALIDTRVTSRMDDPPVLVEPMRRQLMAAIATQRLNRALAQDKWGAARKIIDEILQSNALATTKNEASRILADLDARELFLDPDPNGLATVSAPPADHVAAE